MPASPSLAPIDLDGRVEQALVPLLTSVRRHLHQHPEIGFQEIETGQFIREVLEMHGLEVHAGLAGTGLYVDIGRGERAVGYRADIDALPTPDAKDVPYRSQTPGVAHLCGHDGHTAIAIGVALLLHGLDELPGRVRVFFQPAEEGIPSGAPRMIEDGVLDGLEAAYAVHVDPTLPTGRFGLIGGAATAAADRFSVFVRSATSGHSARPHQGVDTVWVATEIARSIYSLVGRVTDSRNPAVITICRFFAGEAFNVIPQVVEFGGTLRCTDHDDREVLRRRIENLAYGIGQAHGADIEVMFESGPPAVINDGRLVEIVADAAREQAGPDAVYRIPRPSMGGEDFAHYLLQVPGVLVRVGTSSGPNTSHALHDACFDLDEAALAPAAAVMARTLLMHLERQPLG